MAPAVDPTTETMPAIIDQKSVSDDVRGMYLQ